MTGFVHIPHPHVLRRLQRGPVRISDEHVGINGLAAAFITRTVGSMWSVYGTLAMMGGWMALGTWGFLHRLDPYPFPFMLFLGNVVQLLLTFVILVGQQVLGKAADRRAMQTYEDAEAIFQEVSQLHEHMEAQSRLLCDGLSLVEPERHPWIEEHAVERPPMVRHAVLRANERVAAWLTQSVGSMWAVYVAVVVQLGWIALALVGVLRFDPYPFAFLLFLSSLAQLLFMFVIMVGQDVLGRAGDQRSQQTFLDAEAILHECHQLQGHLTAQDEVVKQLCTYVREHAPQDHPVRRLASSR